MPKPEYSDIEFMREMKLSPDPIVTSNELAKKFNLSQQAVYSRLRKLQAENYVRSKKVGSRARVWWLTDKGEQQLDQ